MFQSKNGPIPMRVNIQFERPTGTPDVIWDHLLGQFWFKVALFTPNPSEGPKRVDRPLLPPGRDD